jgi:hypothetical protein
MSGSAMGRSIRSSQSMGNSSSDGSSAARSTQNVQTFSGSRDSGSPGRSFRYSQSNSGSSNSSQQVLNMPGTQNSGRQISRDAGRSIVTDQQGGNSNANNNASDAFRRARGNSSITGNPSNMGLQGSGANNNNSNPSVVRSGRGTGNQFNNNQSNNNNTNSTGQNVISGDSNRRTIGNSPQNSGNFARGARRGAPTTKQVSEFLNLPTDNGPATSNNSNALKRDLGNNQVGNNQILGNPVGDNDNGSRFTRGRRGGGIGDAISTSDGKTDGKPGSIAAGGAATIDQGAASGDNLRGGRGRRGNGDLSTGKNVISDPTNTVGNNNNNNNDNDGNRGRGGRGGQRGARGGGDGGPNGIVGNNKSGDGNDRDFVNGMWNVGRGRGGGDHRDWSGKWNNSDRLVTANKIRNDWKHRNWHDNDNFPFRGNWWNKHHHHGHNHWNFFIGYYNDPFYWWRWSTPTLLTGWFGFGWPTPYYWDYGYGEYIYCYDGAMYVNGRWFEPAPVYYQQTVQLVESAPVFTPEQAVEVQWMPLGVFAVTQDGVANDNMVVQLAVTKDGVIGGTALNKQTGASFDVKGTVDKQTQRAVWSYTDATGALIVMESSVFNLTQPQATGLVHYSPDNIKVIELVRLEEPAAEGAVGADEIIDQ